MSENVKSEQEVKRLTRFYGTLLIISSVTTMLIAIVSFYSAAVSVNHINH